MRKIISCIVLLVCTTMAFAQRVKPTLPEPATIEEGKYYYLWNEEAGLFVDTENNSDSDIAPYPLTDVTFKFHATSEGTYYGKWRIERSDGRYLYSGGDNVYMYSTNNFDRGYYFYVTQLEDGCYTIQRNCNHVESEYVGVANGIYANCTTNTKWRLIPADNVEATRMMLYLTLQNVGESYNTDAYDELLSASNDQQELLKAAKEMNTAVDFTNKYAQKSWSYPLFFINDSQYPWSEYSDYGYCSYSTNKVQGYTSRLKAVVEVDAEEATLSFEAYCSYNGRNTLNVYIDGELVRTVPQYQIDNGRKYYHMLGKGVHIIEWECIDKEDNNSYSVQITDIYVEPTPTISVSLLEPGSLGTEVLAQVNHIKDVFRLKVKGEMNAEDWATIQLMPNLYSADLGEAIITEIPNEQFRDHNSRMHNFHQVILPEGLTRIGDHAFRDTEIEEIKFPSTLKELGEYAVAGTLLTKALIPESVSTIGTYAFEDCRSLVEVSYPAGMTYIPNGCFYNCFHLLPFDFPENLSTIGEQAFRNTYYFRKKAVFTESLKSIGLYSFAGSKIDTLIVPENVTINERAFVNCNELVYAELPTTYYDGSTYRLFHGCSSLKTIKLKSPTVLNYYSDYFINNDYRGNITLQVPDYLVSAYKLNSYWCNFGTIEGFATSEIDTWTIQAPLKLDAKSRFQGNPNIILSNTTLQMSGETGMEVNDFGMTQTHDSRERYSASSQVLMSAETVVNGKLTLDYWTRANQWFYVALPFDIRVGDIQTSAQYAIRYYDGAHRASTSAATGNWKNYTADDIIPAGTGFVFQTSKDIWNRFVAYENTNKNRAFAAKDLTTPLQENACEESAHKGWNLVGNPWMTWFNIHTVDFTAPITVYDQYNNRYQAYSIIDDDVALHPTQAFFVQCPDDIESITFPARGRQLTSEITDQNGARSISARRLIDVELSNDKATDQTRVVMNHAATLGYDYGSDASKFFADTETVQLYTLDADGESYAINERPTDNGLVYLAFVAPTSGNYTLTLSRNQLGNVILKDLLLGTETNLSHGDYYFSSDAGTFTDRFVLAFNTQTTGMEEVLEGQTEVSVIAGGIQTTGIVQVFATDGRLVAEGEGFVPLKQGLYVVRSNSESFKIVVK